MEDRIEEILVDHSPERAQCVNGHWFCPACQYDYGVFAPEVVEDEREQYGHVAALLAELVTEYQAKAWDKGFDKGASISRWWERNPGISNKQNKNPYRAQLEHHNGRR